MNQFLTNLPLNVDVSIQNRSNPESSGLRQTVDESIPNKSNPESSGLRLNVDESIPIRLVFDLMLMYQVQTNQTQNLLVF